MKKNLSIRVKLMMILMPILIMVAIGIATVNMLYSQNRIIYEIEEKVNNNLLVR